MASLKEVRNRIQSVSSTQQITKAMKMVAAAKLRRAQDSITQMRPYSQKLSAILSNLSAASEDSLVSRLSEVRTLNRVLIVVVTSDRGLCGAFNSNIIKAATYLINNKYKSQAAQGNVHLMCIGKKGYEFFAKRGFKVIDAYATIFSNLRFDAAKPAAEEAMNSFLDGTYDKVEIIYNEFRNVATQIIQVEQFLPIEESNTDNTNNSVATDYILEPSANAIIDELTPKSLKIQFYKALLESNASEHGARMTAMDKATDNAGELLKELKLTYNRTRQAAITKEILEIVGGAEALASS
jgi:F-type H+-transporting ATPase subunit gamma